MTPTIPADTDLSPAATNGLHAPEPELEDDGLPPPSEGLLARLRERDWLDGEYNAGRLAQYYGQFVVSANHTLLASDPFYFSALDKAKVKADELGIPHDTLTVYNTPCADPMRIE